MFDPDAPDFKNIKAWINSPPLSMFQLRKRIVLLDFWTYSCVNCRRTLPFLKMLHEKYSDKGLLIIGIHTPEFEFEKSLENVKKAVEREGIKYPVALDSENTTWKLYGNMYWPRRALVNGRGKIVLEQVGEEGFTELELKIIEMLHEMGVRADWTIEKDMKVSREERLMNYAKMQRRTPEIYLGWERNQGFGNSQVCIPKSCVHFIDRGDHKDNVVYLQGDWIQQKESLKHEGNDTGYVVLKYTAKSVNAVLKPHLDGGRFRVYIYLDGKPLDRSIAGRDVKIHKADKRSYIDVDHPDMFELVETDTIQTHEIKLETDDDQFEIFTFTFG